MKADSMVIRVVIVPVLAIFLTVLPPPMAQPYATRAHATGGLPTVTKVQGLFSEAALLTADPEIQKAYVAGVLDALIAVFAEGEAFAEAGLDPRNAYGILYEAVSGIPGAIPLESLQETILESAGSGAGDQAAALVIWRTLALSHCCWGR